MWEKHMFQATFPDYVAFREKGLSKGRKKKNRILVGQKISLEVVMSHVSQIKKLKDKQTNSNVSWD